MSLLTQYEQLRKTALEAIIWALNGYPTAKLNNPIVIGRSKYKHLYRDSAGQLWLCVIEAYGSTQYQIDDKTELLCMVADDLKGDNQQ